jgi:hypothetical protein
MDDKFLYQNRPPVRQGFSERLYAHISSVTSQKKVSTKAFAFALRFALASLFVFVLLFIFSEPVRAGVLNWIKYIAGYEVHEMDSLSEIMGPNAPSYFLRRNSLVYALKDLPFEFAIPAYTPDGYVLVDKLEFDDTSVYLSWINQNDERIFMIVSQASAEFGPGTIIGPNSAEEIHINGRPAMLVHGSYDLHNEWDPNFKRLSIYLIKDGLSYMISNSPHSPNTTGMEDFEKELVRMASSIPDLKNYDSGIYTYTPQPAEEILQNPPFGFEMPGYMPSGYLPREGMVVYSKTWVSIYWQNETGKEIDLFVQQEWRITAPAGIVSAEQQRINARSTLVIRGGFNENGDWDSTKKEVQLYWRDGGLIYILSSDTASEEELINIAESIE